jgi:DNA invertase Pin-like site-specific DNA recombinase
MSIAAYIRVSSQSQKSDSQRAEITRWLIQNGHTPDTVQWFEDTESGASLRRAGFQRLQAAIFQGVVRTVVVWKLDRLARNLREGVNVIADWCQNGVRVVSITQQIDLSGPTGHLIASLLFGVAEIELQHVKERQAVGIALAKERGIYQGRKSGTTKAKPDRARELGSKGLTRPEIARSLGVNKRTVYRYLKTGMVERLPG